ncbi:hypothetical protein 97L [Ranavirus ambystoma1]|uniref:Uncharacterized protein n=1 Tax=Ranavirus ambystoma1 TaxID=265294 RepID=A0A0U2R915_9VIRU|nr:hypothetical protein 97L [Ambystoma tigrinum virus]
MLVGIRVKVLEYILVGYGQLCDLLQYNVIQAPLASDNLYNVCVDKVHNKVLCVCHSFGCCTNAAVIWILPGFDEFTPQTLSCKGP